MATSVPKTMGKGRPLTRLKPGQLVGSGTVNVLIDFYNAFIKASIANGASNQILISSANILFLINSAGSGSAGGQVAAFRITDTFADIQDFFSAQQMKSDGSFSSTATLIAKHYKDRPSITSDTVNGLSVTYSYTDNFNRTTTQGSNSQKEQLFREPITNDIVFCGQLPFTDPDIISDDPITWVDLTPRVWARKKDQS